MTDVFHFLSIISFEFFRFVFVATVDVHEELYNQSNENCENYFRKVFKEFEKKIFCWEKKKFFFSHLSIRPDNTSMTFPPPFQKINQKKSISLLSSFLFVVFIKEISLIRSR